MIFKYLKKTKLNRLNSKEIKHICKKLSLFDIATFKIFNFISSFFKQSFLLFYAQKLNGRFDELRVKKLIA